MCEPALGRFRLWSNAAVHGAVGERLGLTCGRINALQWPFVNGHVDQRCGNGQCYPDPPHGVIRARPVVEVAPEPYAEEAAELVAEEDDAE